MNTPGSLSTAGYDQITSVEKGASAANPYYWRKGDHQMLLRNLVVQTKPKITDKWDYFDVKGVVPENLADLEKVFGSPEANGCHMT